jgi:hypothetical protein
LIYFIFASRPRPSLSLTRQPFDSFLPLPIPTIHSTPDFFLPFPGFNWSALILSMVLFSCRLLFGFKIGG